MLDDVRTRSDQSVTSDPFLPAVQVSPDYLKAVRPGGSQRGSQRGHVHGSGGRLPHLANLCGLPACTRLPPPGVAKIIPRIFRIMVGGACRPSVFQAWHIPSCYMTCERPWVLATADACRRLLLLLSPLLSAAAEETDVRP